MIPTVHAIKRRPAAVLMLFLLLVAVLPLFQATNVKAESYQKVYEIPVKHGIERGLEAFLQRGFVEAQSQGADLIILDINTPGGRIDAAGDIGKLIRESPVPVVAYIDQQAFSAGTYLALNAKKIVMTPGSSMGAATPIDLEGNAASAKIISAWSDQMAAAAELNKRDPKIARAMVELDTTIPGMKEKGKVLSLHAEEAKKAGYADQIVAGKQELYSYLGIASGSVHQIEPTLSEKISRFVTSPTVIRLLLIIGLVGLVAELFIPGFGVAGTISALAFALYFFGNFVAGFANWLHILLFLFGVLLLVMEIFVPGAILGIIGFVSIVSSLVMAAYDTKQGVASLGIAAIVTVVVGFVLFRMYGFSKLWSKFVLREEQQKETGYVAAKDQSNLLGKRGHTLTPLRPAGIVKIEGRRIDAVSAGSFIAAGTNITVSAVEGSRVVVQEEEA